MILRWYFKFNFGWLINILLLPTVSSAIIVYLAYGSLILLLIPSTLEGQKNKVKIFKSSFFKSSKKGNKNLRLFLNKIKHDIMRLDYVECIMIKGRDCLWWDHQHLGIWSFCKCCEYDGLVHISEFSDNYGIFMIMINKLN